MSKQHNDNDIVAYIDGACKGNPGVGGWGVFIQCAGNELQLCGARAHTTNNKMELQAAIALLRTIRVAGNLTVYTDSAYVKNGIESWIAGWKRKNWRTANNQPVKNVDQWQRLDTLTQLHKPKWQWVKGHSGNYGNEMADTLANEAIVAYLRTKT